MPKIREINYVAKSPMFAGQVSEITQKFYMEALNKGYTPQQASRAAAILTDAALGKSIASYSQADKDLYTEIRRV